MKRSRLPGIPASTRRLLWSAAMLAVACLTAPASSAAQAPPPSGGTVALQGTMKTFYKAANVVVVTTVDGVEHVYRFAKDLVVHGGKGSGVDALEGLREGTTVVVHYTPDGAEPTAHEIDRIDRLGLEATEGVVTRIDRGRKQITVRYDNGRTETFRLTDRAAAESAADETGAPETRVAIYYSNQSGRKVAHFFKPVEKPR